MKETTIKRQKHSARINDQFDATIFLAEAEHDGERFFFGTGLVTSDFHRWFGHQIQCALAQNENFDGCIFVEIEDGRIGRALISHLENFEDAGSKMSFIFHGDLAKPHCTKEQCYGD